MREAERDPDQDDRSPPSIAHEQRIAETPEGELFDDWRDDRDHDAVCDVGRGVVGFPGIGRDALLPARVEQRAE